MGAALWSRVAELPLHIESYEVERLEAGPAWAWERVTSQVRLLGHGTDGLGEDISLVDEEHAGLFEAPPSLPLIADWTLGAFCEFVAGLDQWPEPPEWDTARNWRNWAFESAALDLALRQAGRPLHEVLGRDPRPVRFVNSLGLGDDPSTETIHRRLATHPTVGFKLDAAPAWSQDLLDDLAATGAVQQVDFKGHYGLEVADEDALVVLYERVVARFPDAILEDPHDLPRVTEIVEPHRDRVAYDAPIHSAEDIAATPIPARIVNVKPSRIGSLRALLELYEHCERHGLRMYGGGMGEIGVGRGQVELLASLFHAHEPNDVAPSGFNATEPAPDLPQSPLEPKPAPTGFRWDEAR
jgi:L-alanine-DL-glutamate epimerase-like enolase superfamily enzyme